jgi:hypothetical protein
LKETNPMKMICFPLFGRTALIAALLSPALAAVATAQVVVVPTTPQIGSSNPITAQPQEPRPGTSPCVVQLFSNLAFADFTPKTFSYAPPSGCPGPWAKVVFTADFTVTAGRQFDRTAAFYLGHANIFYGTTAEPRSSLSPSWHVEHDVTDLTSLFLSTQTGEANIGNFVGVSGGVTYNGIIYANAALEFYPVSWQNPAPITPDIVVPVNGGGGDAGTLNTTSDTISQTLNLPTNVERVFLDIIAQSQINDEFWYFCVPNDQTSNLESCGNTAFRETEVWIDGNPAGVAPVYPWIYTGGIDPYLWEPIPGVQTLDFKPYRVNLTPSRSASITLIAISSPPRTCSYLRITAHRRLPVGSRPIRLPNRTPWFLRTSSPAQDRLTPAVSPSAPTAASPSADGSTRLMEWLKPR